MSLLLNPASIRSSPNNLPYNVVFQRRLYHYKGCPTGKVVLYREGCLQAKFFFQQSLSSNIGFLPSKVVFWFPSKFKFHQGSSSFEGRHPLPWEGGGLVYHHRVSLIKGLGEGSKIKKKIWTYVQTVGR